MASKRTDGREHTPDPEHWVDEHADVLFRYALARVAKPDVAEELVQETFLAALSNRERFGGRSSERTWLVGILKHKIVDYFRRKAREAAASEPPTSGDLLDELFDQRGRWKIKPTNWAADPRRLVEQQEFRRAFGQCLSALPERQAAAFTLREMEHLASEEVCKVLQVTSTNLWVLLHRARVALCRCLEAGWFGSGTERT